METLGYRAYEIQQPPTRIKTAPRLVRLEQALQRFQYDVCFIKFDDLHDFWTWSKALKGRKYP
jgi:hypothetical protein